MIYFNNFLKDDSPIELCEFVSSCDNYVELVKKLEEDPERLFSFVQSMKTEENEELTELLTVFLYKLTPEQLENAEIKKVETVLRRRGVLNQNSVPDLNLQPQGKDGFPINAHKSILALESPYFLEMVRFKKNQQNDLLIKGEKYFISSAKDEKNLIVVPKNMLLPDIEISPECMKKTVEYLYSSEEDRKNLIAALDKKKLPEMAGLADRWLLNELKTQCDEELCNSVSELCIDNNDLDNWLDQSQYIPKFTLLLEVAARISGDGNLNSVIDQMQTMEGAAWFASKCTPKEIEAFSTLNTAFGQACRIPPGTFGKAEWEKAFPVSINEVPPLPINIHATLEMEDPCEPGKKLKETCMLFLRPREVIFCENGISEELLLSFDGVERLAQNAVDPARRAKFITWSNLNAQMNRLPTAEAGWVLMRKELIPGSRNQNFKNQQQLLKGSFEVPKVMDAILLNILTFVSEGKYLYGKTPWTYTHCQEQYNGWQVVVGDFGSSGLYVSDISFDCQVYGLSGTWKF